MKEIILRLGSGSLETGFPSVNVELRDRTYGRQQSHWESVASLPSSPELKNVYEEWQYLYQNSLRQSGQRGVTFAPMGPTNIRYRDIQEITHELVTALNDWLNQGDFHHEIQAQLRTELNASDRITIAIVTDNLLLWQLPWHRWDFFKSYDHCVEFFSKRQFKNLSRQPQPNGKVDILALWGNAPELNLAKDLAALQQPRAVVKSCQPKSAIEISDRLAAGQIDILFFGGHGETIELEIAGKLQTLGAIYLDKKTPIEIDKIKKDLQKAVDRGLQIAIFNCCSGLGLAQELADLNIPYLIVMRSQISDQLAQQFCRDLLLHYSQGYLFTAAFQYARDRLKPATDRSDEFESWLPMLLHNPNSNHVTWQQLCHSRGHIPLPSSIVRANQWLTKPSNKPLAWLGLSLLSTNITIGLRILPLTQNIEAIVLDKFQYAQVKIMPPKSHVAIVDISAKDDQKNNKNQNGIVVIGREYLSSPAPLQDLSKVSFLALGIDLKFNTIPPDSFIHNSNVSLDCKDLSPNINYPPQPQGCLHLITKIYPKVIRHPSGFILNSHLSATIPRISLSNIVANPTVFADKFLLVGAIENESSQVVRYATAAEQIIRAAIAQQHLPTKLTNHGGAIYLWGWSALSSALIFNRRRLLAFSAIIVLLSVATGWLLFLYGFVVPLIASIIVISISGAFIFIVYSSHQANL
jgi:hypothetical protein